MYRLFDCNMKGYHLWRMQSLERETLRRKKNINKKKRGKKSPQRVHKFQMLKSVTAGLSQFDASEHNAGSSYIMLILMFVLSLPFLAFALPILQHCLTAAHPIKAPARIDLQPLLTLMQIRCAQPMGCALSATGWSPACSGNFESRKSALTHNPSGWLQVHSVHVSVILLFLNP